MCDECGLTWCHSMCPNYDPYDDPSVSGFCENCGEPIYTSGETLCADCREEDD